MKLFILIALFSIPVNISAQDTLMIYLDFNYTKADEEDAHIKRTAIFYDSIIQIKDHTFSGKKIKLLSYESLDPAIMQGKAEFYYPPGQLYAHGSYENNLLSGEWNYFVYDSIVKRISVNYDIPKYFNDEEILTRIKRTGRRTRIDEKIVSDSLKNFLEKNIIIPGIMAESYFHRIVSVDVVLDTDGKIKFSELRNPYFPDLDREIARVASQFISPQFPEHPVVFSVLFELKNKVYKPYMSISTYDDVYDNVDELPFFPGGDENLMRFFAQTLTYPQAAREKSIQGTVFVTFIVEKDGSISNIEILRGVSDELDNEAIRVISSMPEWIPGKADNKTVRVSFNLPIRFILD
ncbi:MAG: energy transducer TonB [Bacteroidetes bacterium]|nr:MAG: energy transducer TonB [Bacteroidota bacterium]